MEYISRGKLRTQLLEYIDPLNVLIDIARGMVFLHEQGIIHRDIKPSNILVCKTRLSFLSLNPHSHGQPQSQITDQGDAKIADFGGAKHVEDDPSLVPWRGTADFRPPEFTWEKPLFVPAGDVYSFGRIIQWMDAEKPETAVLNRYDRDLKEIAEKCWKDPISTKPIRWDQRPTAQQILQKLEQLALED